MDAIFDARVIGERGQFRGEGDAACFRCARDGAPPGLPRPSDRSKMEAGREDHAAQRQILYARAPVILEVQIPVA
jgi:hypothetical protein